MPVDLTDPVVETVMMICGESVRMGYQKEVDSGESAIERYAGFDQHRLRNQGMSLMENR